MWEGPPTDKTERSGKVKGKQGKGLGEKKGRREGKLHNCKSTPVQPVSAMRGEGREGGGVSAETDGWCRRCAAVGEREWLERGKLTGAGEGGSRRRCCWSCSSGRDAGKDRAWKRLGCAKREGAGVLDGVVNV